MIHPAWCALRRAFIARFLVLMICMLLTAACTAQRGPLPPTVVPSPVPATSTSIPAAASPSPTPTITSLDSLIPTGVPARSWEGIPIMPEALAGDGDEFGYTFTVRTRPDEIIDYYRREMAGLGWEYSVAGSSAANGSLMVFLKENVTITISYFPYGDEMLVLIVK